MSFLFVRGCCMFVKNINYNGYEKILQLALQ